MKRMTTWGMGLLGLLLVASNAQAQGYYWVHPVSRQPIMPAPDTFGPGFYTQNGPSGMVYGPNYYLTPPWAPFQGVLPCPPRISPQGKPMMPPLPQQMPKAGGPQNYLSGPFPSHPYVRGPRDFFMWNEAQEDARIRESRPNLVP